MKLKFKTQFDPYYFNRIYQVTTARPPHLQITDRLAYSYPEEYEWGVEDWLTLSRDFIHQLDEQYGSTT